jgi:hypothetical protein
LSGSHFDTFGDDEMANKGKKASKNATPGKKRIAKQVKRRISSKPASIKKKKSSMLAEVAAKPTVRSRAKVTKTPEEMEGLRRKFVVSVAAGTAGACYFKDPSGGPDQCIPATQEDCQREGGQWSPGNCPQAVVMGALVTRATVTKRPEELQVLSKKFAATISAAVAGACYFKDPSGGPDQCVPATQQDCKDEGGAWSPGNCPN